MNNKIFIFDTNVWLDFYKLHPDIISHITLAIENHLHKFWLPNQVYLEFNRNLTKNKNNLLNRFKDVRSQSSNQINDLKNKITSELKTLSKNGFIENEDLIDDFEIKCNDLAKNLKKELNKLNTEYEKTIENKSLINNDIIVKQIEKLYMNNTQKGFKTFELIKIYEEGEIRYKNNIPPGFTDANKDDEEIKKKNLISNNEDLITKKYGDLIMWKEILREVSSRKSNLVFVQNEKKADWWQAKKNQKISPLLEKEFKDVTGGDLTFEMFNFFSFIEKYGEEIGLPVRTIEEIKNKISFDKELEKHLLENTENILSSIIEERYLEDYKLYEHLIDYSLFGGSIESVENAELNQLTIIEKSVGIDELKGLGLINLKFLLDIDADITEYINKYVYEKGKIIVDFYVHLFIDFNLDYSDFDAENKDKYEITKLNFFIENIEDIRIIEHDIDVSVDEDMFRER